MKTRSIGLALTCTVLLAVTSAFGQDRPSDNQIPRSQYSPMAAARAQGPSAEPESWYDFLLKQFNPNNLDYGRWMEQRRRAFLEATARNPYFSYSFWLTLWSLLVMSAYAKLWIDRRRERFVTEEMMTDLYNHDLHSREAAKEAIERHNSHIECCNRVIERAEAGQATGGSDSDAGRRQAEAQQAATELKAIRDDRDRLQRDLEGKTLLIAEMSLRMDALSDAMNGNGKTTQVGGATSSSAASNSEYVKLINSLQEQLHAERERNKRLKGA